MADESDRIAPVALPAGSFDLGKLEKALGAATSVKDRDQHPERINKAIADTIEQPEILANMDRPIVPFGASLVETEIVYRDGDEPVKRETVVFNDAGAESGDEASRMAYARDGDKIVATDEPEAIAASEAERANGDGKDTTLAAAAAAAVGDTSDSAAPAKAGSK